MTDFVVMKDGVEVARYENDRASAQRHVDLVDGELVQAAAPTTTYLGDEATLRPGNA